MSGKGGLRSFTGARPGGEVAPIPDLPAHRYDTDDLRLRRKPDGSRLSAGTKVVRKTVLGPAAESNFLDLPARQCLSKLSKMLKPLPENNMTQILRV